MWALICMYVCMYICMYVCGCLGVWVSVDDGWRWNRGIMESRRDSSEGRGGPHMSQTGVEMHKRHQTTAQNPLHILYLSSSMGNKGNVLTYTYLCKFPSAVVGGRRRCYPTEPGRAGGIGGALLDNSVTWCLSLVGRSINQLAVACIAPSTHNELRVNKIVKQTQHRLSETVTSTLGASFARCALHSVQSL